MSAETAPGCAIPACLCCREAEECGGQRQFAPTPSQNQGGEKTEHLNHTRWPRLVSSPFVALQLRPQQNRGGRTRCHRTLLVPTLVTEIDPAMLETRTQPPRTKPPCMDESGGSWPPPRSPPCIAPTHRIWAQLLSSYKAISITHQGIASKVMLA